MRKKSSFDELIADTEALEKRLANPADFYQDKQAPYHQTAAAIARRILLAARPQETPPDRWRVKVETIVSRVTAHLLLAGIGGIQISVSAPAEAGGELAADKNSRPPSQMVTHNDIVEWVKAGENGLPGGKIWKSEDSKRFAAAGGGDKGYRAIATVVMRAYYSRRPQANYVRLRRAVQRYISGTSETAGEPLLDAIATAWVEHFTLRLTRDLRQHAGKLVREF